jgi:hypothetical protein
MKLLAKTIPNSFPNLNLMPTTPDEIKNIIISLKSKNSCDYDEISSKLLKSCVDYISIPLSYLCNHSMAIGIFPERLKYSKAKPLSKKG